MTRQELLAQVLTPDKVPVREPYPAIYCYECGRQLRSVDGFELEEIHTGEDGEDVCEDCCMECNGNIIENEPVELLGKRRLAGELCIKVRFQNGTTQFLDCPMIVNLPPLSSLKEVW